MNFAIFGAGCFWCVEAIFETLDGVMDVQAGYAGGNIINPSYEDICTGTTGHAEVIQITYNADVISFDKLLNIFWTSHDPTTINQQGADIGTQYRSVIFHHNKVQQKISKESMDKVGNSAMFVNPIITGLQNLETCDVIGEEFFNLTEATSQIDPIYTLSFHFSEADAQNNENPIQNPENFQNTDGKPMFLTMDISKFKN